MKTDEPLKPPLPAREGGGPKTLAQVLEETRHLNDDPEASDLAKGLWKALERKAKERQAVSEAP